MAGPGDIHLCSAWEPHGWRVASPNTSQVVLIFLPEIVANEMLRDVPWLSFFTVPPRQRPRAASPVLRREILHTGKLIARESVDQRSGWQAAVRSLLFYMLVLLGRHWEPAKKLVQTQVAASSFSRLMPAVDLVHRDPARQTGLEEAAASCGLGRSRFVTLFRQTMGVSFGQFRRRAQMARVAHLLLTTDLPTDAVAEAAGFVDGSHLHRVFVQYYGRTPGQYRKDNR
jgi:AraC-like DNA-binding protein